MKKFQLFLASFLGMFTLIFPAAAQAVCPACTVAVAGGLGISRWLGIDDTIAGLWIGALTVSMGLWLAVWMENKKWQIPYKNTLSVALFFVLMGSVLYLANVIGMPGNSLWGVDKIVLGILVGAGVFRFTAWLDKWLKANNDGQVYVYYQKVILPVFFLSVASFIFYQITV